MKLPTLVLALLLGPVGLVAQSRPDTAARGPVASAAPDDPGRLLVFRQDFRLGLHLTKKAVAAPLHWSKADWVAVPATAVALVTLSGADEPVHDAFDRNRAGAVDRVLTAIEPFGAQGAIATVVGTYLVGLALDVPVLRRAGVEAAASSIVASGIVTPGLKRLIGRARPWQGQGAFSFHALTGNESFPSGHTTQAFAAASVFAAEAHPLWAKALIYGVAGGVATARLYHDAHFLSDVTAGATIGTVVGRSVVATTQRRLGPTGGLTPYVGGDGVGVALHF